MVVVRIVVLREWQKVIWQVTLAYQFSEVIPLGQNVSTFSLVDITSAVTLVSYLFTSVESENITSAVTLVSYLFTSVGSENCTFHNLYKIKIIKRGLFD